MIMMHRLMEQMIILVTRLLMPMLHWYRSTKLELPGTKTINMLRTTTLRKNNTTLVHKMTTKRCRWVSWRSLIRPNLKNQQLKLLPTITHPIENKNTMMSYSLNLQVWGPALCAVCSKTRMKMRKVRRIKWGNKDYVSIAQFSDNIYTLRDW